MISKNMFIITVDISQLYPNHFQKLFSTYTTKNIFICLEYDSGKFESYKQSKCTYFYAFKKF